MNSWPGALATQGPCPSDSKGEWPSSLSDQAGSPLVSQVHPSVEGPPLMVLILFFHLYAPSPRDGSPLWAALSPLILLRVLPLTLLFPSL